MCMYVDNYRIYSVLFEKKLETDFIFCTQSNIWVEDIFRGHQDHLTFENEIRPFYMTMTMLFLC